MSVCLSVRRSVITLRFQAFRLTRCDARRLHTAALSRGQNYQAKLALDEPKTRYLIQLGLHFAELETHLANGPFVVRATFERGFQLVSQPSDHSVLLTLWRRLVFPLILMRGNCAMFNYRERTYVLFYVHKITKFLLPQ